MQNAGRGTALRVSLLACVLVVAGCKPAGMTVYPATGTITYKGKPVAGATVMFVPAKGTPCDGRTDEAGHYTILHRGKPGAPAGTCRVTVTKLPASAMSTDVDNPTPEDLARLSAQAMAKNPMPAKAKEELPAKFSNATTSGLSAEVTSDATKNVFDFDLGT